MSALSYDQGVRWLVLDLLLRRSILRPSILVEWIVSENYFDALSRDVWIWSLVELPVQRALDITRAALAKWKSCQKVGGPMEVVARYAAQDMSGARTQIIGGANAAKDTVAKSTNDGAVGGMMSPKVNTSDQPDNEMDVDVQDEDSRRDGDSERATRASSAGDDVLAGADASVVADMEETSEEDMFSAVLASSAAECRNVFKIVIGQLLVELSKRYLQLGQHATSDEIDIDPWLSHALSLLRRLLRAFYGTQKTISREEKESLILVYSADDISQELSVPLPQNVVKACKVFNLTISN